MGQIDTFRGIWKENGMWDDERFGKMLQHWENCGGGMVDVASERLSYACFCLHCGKGDGPLYKICGYCNGTKFTRGQAQEGDYGLFCLSCHRGWTDWTCKHCGQPNDLLKSLLQRRKLPDEK